MAEGTALAAYQAWFQREAKDRRVDDVFFRLWEAAWEELDFSWEGLAKANHADDAPLAQEVKAWRAPPDFPLDRPVEGTGKNAHKPASVQDFWRPHHTYGDGAWAFSDADLAHITEAGAEPYDARGFATDDAMLAAGHLVREAGPSVALGASGGETDLRSTGAGSLRHILHRAAEGGGGESSLVAALLAQRLAWADAYDGPGDRRVQLRGLRQGEEAADAITAFGGPAEAAGKGEAAPPQPTIHLDACWSLWETVQFDHHQFGPNTVFQSAAFQGTVGFQSATFQGTAGFQSAAFQGTAGFESAAFQGHAWFESAAFQGHAWFESTAFQGDAGFESAAFQGTAGFQSAAFQGTARFQSAAFQGTAGFQSAAFQGSANFSGGPGPTVARKAQAISLRRARDDDGPHLQGELEPALTPDPDAHRAFHRVIFTGTRFRGDADFSNRIFRQRAEFDLTHWGRVADFTGSTLRQDTSFRAAKFAGLERWRRWPDTLFGLFGGWLLIRFVATRSLDSVDRYFDRHESAFRALKQAAEDARHRRLESLFHRQEQLARAHRKKEIGPLEKLFSLIYGLTADYGQSIWRPLLALVVATLIFAGGYAAWIEDDGWRAVGAELADLRSPVEASQAGDKDLLVDGLELSLTNVFRPFGVWNPRFLSANGEMSNEVMAELFSDAQPGRALAARLVSAVQSFTGIATLFLLGLALRRRFQID